jgi:hypothetical protein
MAKRVTFIRMLSLMSPSLPLSEAAAQSQEQIHAVNAIVIVFGTMAVQRHGDRLTPG